MQLYEVPGTDICDSWYLMENGVCHAYFLEISKPDQPVGHMTSTDLRNWKYEGVALAPREDYWLNKNFLTGSIAKLDGRYYMLMPGDGSEVQGFAAAVSDDLYHWEFVSETPVIARRGQAYTFRYNDKELSAVVLADPYIYPEPDENGQFTAFINCKLCPKPENSDDFFCGQGCKDCKRNEYPANATAAVATFVSKDLLHWTPSKIACLTSCDRLETPCVWKHGDLWYMYGGETHWVLDENFNKTSEKHWNSLFVSEAFEGPYAPLHRIQLPGDPAWYIGKVITDTDGEEIFIANNPPHGAIGPFSMKYDKYGITFSQKV